MKKITLLTALFATFALGACCTKKECPQKQAAAAHKCGKDGQKSCCKDQNKGAKKY